LLTLAAQLTDAGYRAAIADPRGHGDSGGTYGFNLHEHEDLAAVAKDVLRRCPRTESITFLAFSYGAANAISATARHSLPVTSLLLISPVADFSMIQPRINPFTMHRHITLGQALKTPRFDWHLFRSPKLSAVDDIRNVHAPLSLIHVKNDWLINHTHSVALYDAANEPKELHVIDIPGNYHADRILQRLRHLLGAGAVELAQALGELHRRELLPLAVLGLAHAVGEEDERVAGVEAEPAAEEVRARDDAEDEVGLAELLDRVLADPQRRRVPGVRVLDRPRGGVEAAGEERHELRLRQRLLERGVQLRHQDRRRRIVLAEDAERGLEAGHHQPRGDPLAADVADDEVDLAVGAHHEVVVVAADRAARPVRAGERVA